MRYLFNFLAHLFPSFYLVHVESSVVRFEGKGERKGKIFENCQFGFGAFLCVFGRNRECIFFFLSNACGPLIVCYRMNEMLLFMIFVHLSSVW